MNMKLTLVTGNKGKLVEWQRMMPPDIELEIHDVDAPEIQSLDSEEIVADKARRAYDQLQTPVIVEDVSAGIEKLGWLPGPFVKFFLRHLVKTPYLYWLGDRVNLQGSHALSRTMMVKGSLL